MHEQTYQKLAVRYEEIHDAEIKEMTMRYGLFEMIACGLRQSEISERK